MNPSVLAPYMTVIFIVIVAIVLWWRWRVVFNRTVVVSAVLTLLAFEALYFLHGSLQLPTPESPTSDKIVAALAIILAFNTVVQLVRWLVIELGMNRRGIVFPRFVLDLIVWTSLAVVAAVVISEVFDVELTGVLVTSTVASAVIGLALQDVLGNLIAGVALQIESPFSVGNWVEVMGVEGQVVRLNWRTLALITRTNQYVVLPNSSVSKEKIINFSRPTRKQALDAFIGVAYPHAPGDVKQVLLAAVHDASHVLAEPVPMIHTIGYNDFSVDYRIRYWVERYDYRLEIEDEVMTRLWYALKRNGMVIPFPIRDVNMRLVREDGQEQRVRQMRERNAAFLRALPFLEEWTDEQVQQLAGASQDWLYTQGETLVRQGDQGDSLFIIKQGLVGVYVNGANGGRIRADEKQPGEFFGEMSLLTGEPRSASVVADTETEVLTIQKEAFVEMLTADPDILELMLGVVERRRSNLEASLARDGQKLVPTAERSALLTRVARFLGLTLDT